MADALAVHLNRDDPPAVECPPAFETGGPFAVEFHNHGPPAHVHLRLDGDLAAVARVDRPNPYVEDRATVEVRASGEPGGEVTGTLEVVAGYGAESATVEVTLLPPESTAVSVDESLATPAEGDTAGASWGRRETAMAGLSGAAVLVTSGLALALDGRAALLFGAAAVLAAAGAAALFVQSS